MKLTKRKLIWLEQLQDEIAQRVNHITDYIYRTNGASGCDEEVSSIEIGTQHFPGMTTSKRWIGGEYSYSVYPTETLWSDEALVRFRNEKEQGEVNRTEQQKEAEKEEDRRHLQRIREKHPELFEEKTLELGLTITDVLPPLKINKRESSGSLFPSQLLKKE